jgi:hypothetical protein
MTPDNDAQTSTTAQDCKTTDDALTICLHNDDNKGYKSPYVLYKRSLQATKHNILIRNIIKRLVYTSIIEDINIYNDREFRASRA